MPFTFATPVRQILVVFAAFCILHGPVIAADKPNIQRLVSEARSRFLGGYGERARPSLRVMKEQLASQAKSEYAYGPRA